MSLPAISPPTRDAERLSQHCCKVTQINTGKGCHLDANQVRQGMASMPLEQLDYADH